jgi:hypothetical protein
LAKETGDVKRGETIQGASVSAAVPKKGLDDILVSVLTCNEERGVVPLGCVRVDAVVPEKDLDDFFVAFPACNVQWVACFLD